jgi:hypothetical protein
MTPPTIGPTGVLEGLGPESVEEVCSALFDAVVEGTSEIRRLMLVSTEPLDSVLVLAVSSSDVEVGKSVDSYIESSAAIFAQSYAVIVSVPTVF